MYQTGTVDVEVECSKLSTDGTTSVKYAPVLMSPHEGEEVNSRPHLAKVYPVLRTHHIKAQLFVSEMTHESPSTDLVGIFQQLHRQ